MELLGQQVRLVDLSHRLEPTPSEPLPPIVRAQTHDEGAELWHALYGIPPAALPAGHGTPEPTVWRVDRTSRPRSPAHFAGIERPYLQFEKLANLTTLPATGATLIAFPVKVADGSGAWTRAVALIPQRPPAT